MPLVLKSPFDAVVEFTDKNLNKTTIDYLTSRGWDSSVISKWHLGFFPPNKNSDLYAALSRHGFGKQDLIDARVMNDKGNTLLFNRVIFPIWNTHGKLIAVTGRTLTDEKPKYFNTGYDKGRFLYGLNFAIQRIRELDEAFVYEGNADVVTAHAFDLLNTVGCQGTAFTKEHYNLLSRYTSRIYLVLDNDEGGRKALASFNKRYPDFLSKDKHKVLNSRNKEVEVYIIVLQGAKDPDEYLRKFGREAFLKTVLEQKNNTKLQSQRRQILPKAVDKNAKKRNV